MTSCLHYCSSGSVSFVIHPKSRPHCSDDITPVFPNLPGFMTADRTQDSPPTSLPAFQTTLQCDSCLSLESHPLWFPRLPMLQQNQVPRYFLSLPCPRAQFFALRVSFCFKCPPYPWFCLYKSFPNFNATTLIMFSGFSHPHPST